VWVCENRSRATDNFLLTHTRTVIHQTMLSTHIFTDNSIQQQPSWVALTDHALQENHTINQADASVIDTKPDRATRRIKEAIHIRKEGPQAMNREESSYQLSHTYDRFLGTGLTYCAKNRKNK